LFTLLHKSSRSSRLFSVKSRKLIIRKLPGMLFERDLDVIEPLHKSHFVVQNEVHTSENYDSTYVVSSSREGYIYHISSQGKDQVQMTSVTRLIRNE
jgi:hypothetical protein